MQKNNERNAGRKAVPRGKKKQYIIPEEKIPTVTAFVREIQDEAIESEKIINSKKE